MTTRTGALIVHAPRYLAAAFCIAGLFLVAAANAQTQEVVAGRNVNMVSGTTWPTGDPFLQRQNEPSIAASTRNPLHLLAGANDYRSVELPGLLNDTETGDAWLGVFKSFDGGQRWQSTLLPGFKTLGEKTSPLYGYAAGADPVVRAGTNGMLYYSGLVFDRGTDTAPGKSAVFVSRFIDNNNLETGDPIAYLGSVLVEKRRVGSGQFLDKPWLAVDVPRTSATCSIPATATAPAQVIPAGPMYVAYTVITYSATAPGGLTSQIFMSTSLNCGVTWSPSVRVSRLEDPINQGASIAINPVDGAVYVAWRRITPPNSSNPDAFLVARSANQGRKFSNPGVARRFPRGRKVGLSIDWYFEHRKAISEPVEFEITEFDQATSAAALSFRTNAYPSMTFDQQGRLYVVWAERGYATQRRSDTEGDARIMMTTSLDGTSFVTPWPVDEGNQFGHQIMPTLTFANGKLLLAYYDLREDLSAVFGQYVDDATALTVPQPPDYPFGRRHTIDLRATTAAPADMPVFAPSTVVSEYAWGTLPGETGLARQLQSNPPNLPLFRLGTVPFFGDYIDVTPAPAFVYDGNGFRWQYNTTAGTAPVFHGVWTDNRDVRPPAKRTNDKPDWTNYIPAGAPGYNVCDAGMRNQNIYTARLTTGLVAGSPGNTKPLNMQWPRGFVVFAHNTTDVPRYFRFTIQNQPPSPGRASFLEYPVPPYAPDAPLPLTTLDVVVPRRSVVARTVYVTSPDPKARVNVEVTELDAAGGQPVQDGLHAPVVLNPDISNPDISNPDISNPDISNPDISNAEVHNPDISNPDISNPDISNPDISNPDISNPDISNPDISNPDISNPDISNPDISNPDISNPDISNPDISNPDISNPDISNGSITDVTWTVTNNGNTTTAFDVRLFFNSLTDVPDGIKLQLILYRVYRTPLANGCNLTEQTHNVLVSNIVNPDISNPDISNTPLKAAAAAPEPETPSLWIEPGGIAKITLRIVDTDRTDQNRLDPTEITAEIKSEPKNTPDLPDEEKDAPKAKPEPAPDVPQLAFAIQPISTPAGETMPEVSVSVMNGGTGVEGVAVSLAFADNPSGAELMGTKIATSDGAGLAHFEDLSLTKDGTGFRFVASAGSTDAVPVLSAAFDSEGSSTVVTNTHDIGSGSLRQAILNANAHAGADVISFNIAESGPYIITPATPLPHILGPATIDATTQPGWTGAPLVELNGASAGVNANGFRIVADSTTVRGFVIRGFDEWGVLTTGDHSVVERNFVGTNAAGMAPGPGNAQGGIAAVGASGAVIRDNLIAANTGVGVVLSGGTTNAIVQNNLVGTTAAGGAAVGMGNGGGGISIGGTATSGNSVRGNTIGRNGFQGVDFVQGAHDNVVAGNFIGTNSSGAGGLGNNHNGVRVEQGAFNTTIGGPALADRNVISGNGITGITLALGPGGTPTSGNLIQGNYIGTTPAGDAALPNAGHGVNIGDASGTNVLQNVIAGNGGTGIWLGPNTPGTAVRGNLIGTNALGLAALPNDKGIEAAPGAGSLEIGGLALADRNIISGNTVWGIGINHGVTGTLIRGNFIGINSLGTAPVGNARGIVVFGPGTVIGGLVSGARNVISGNSGLGIEMAGTTSTGSVIQGNYIGVNASGGAALPNGGNGVYISAQSTGITVGGDVAGAGNVVSGNAWTGIMVYGSSNTVQGNLVGLNAAGNAAVSNGDADHVGRGIHVDGGAGNVIGGIVPFARNVVSGNRGSGIYLSGAAATGNHIKGNYAGLDITGTFAVPNNGSGIDVWSSNNVIGGTTAAERNVASGNTANGVGINQSAGNSVKGNYAGTNAAGTAAVANGTAGIFMNAVTGSTIGGPEFGAGNLASGNTMVGIYVAYASQGNTVSGNFVGTDKDGSLAIPNAHGVFVGYGPTNNTIGGVTAADRNLISGNTWSGVLISGNTTANNVIQGNHIGISTDPARTLGNGTGVRIDKTVGGALDNVIQGNTIANSTAAGIVAEAGSRNRFLGNAILNSVVGIDLWPAAGGDGATPNDPGDADAGANGLQNYPELAWADNSVTIGKTTVQYTFNSTPSTPFTLHFYANAACAPPARTAETAAVVTSIVTDGTGTYTGTAEISPVVPEGSGITATATGPEGTSELSACVPVIGGTPLNFAVLNTNDSGPGSFRQTILDANSHPGPDSISFSLVGVAPFTISPTSALPQITGPVLIDATTQTGYVDTPVVELSGAAAGGPNVYGLYITAGSSTVRGLVVNMFSGHGIEIAAGGGNLIAGNYVGVDVTGTLPRSNGLGGISISSSTGNTIGGLTAADRNVVSANGSQGIALYTGADGNFVRGNYVGTNALGSGAVPNSAVGILLDGGDNNVIGGAEAGARNVVSGNATIGISIRGATANVVQGNVIGLDQSATTLLGNGGGGVSVSAASSDNLIGGLATGAGNVISGNTGQGVAVRDASTAGTGVQGNYIGTNETGTLARANSEYGVYVYGAGTTRIERNLISGNTAAGVLVSGATGTAVHGNVIGTNAAGTMALPNAHGVYITNGATATRVGGLERNLLSGNTYSGVTIEGSNSNEVFDNYIGTNTTGDGVVANGSYGVVVQNALSSLVSGNVIGGHATPGSAGVVISSSGGSFSSGNTVALNHIGINAAGTAALANYAGVRIDDGSFGNHVDSNVVSGNVYVGVSLTSGSQDNVVAGNKIGTNNTGTAAVGNAFGILVQGAPNNAVGGPNPADRNLVSGNTVWGIAVSGAESSGTIVQGNYVGTSDNGAAALANATGGIYLSSTTGVHVDQNLVSGNGGFGVQFGPNTTASRIYYNRIGTNPDSSAAVANGGVGAVLSGPSTTGNEVRGNVISGNGSSGVELSGGAASNLVQFNLIGRGTDALVAIPNAGHGVYVSDGDNNTIGSPSSLGQNSIGYNGQDGVRINLGSTGTTLLGNNIWSNVGLGINQLNPYPPAPGLTYAGSVTVPSPSTTVTGAINLGGPGIVPLRIEFFGSAACDGSGSGEGGQFLGSVNVTTNDSGVAMFKASFPLAVPVGHVITATTVTSESGGETSAFSVCQTVVGG